MSLEIREAKGAPETAKDGKPVSALSMQLEDLRARGAEYARTRVADAEMTLSFLSGNQWVEYTWEEGIAEVENLTQAIRITDNRMLPAFRRWMHYLFKERPVIVAYEGGHELRDTETAAVASSLCDYWEAHCGWEQARRKALAWMAVCGVGYVMPLWREVRMRKVRRRRLEFIEEGVEGQNGVREFLKETWTHEYPEDVGFEALNPLTTYTFPLDADEWRKVESIMHVELVTKEWLRSNVPEAATAKIGNMAPVSRDAVNLEALGRIARYVSPQFGYSSDDTWTEDRYLLVRWWERPSKEHPDGRYVAVAGGVVVFEGKLPYVKEAREADPTDEHNVTMGIVPVFAADFPGRLVPPSPMGQLRDAQIRLNDLLTDQARNRKSVGRNKLLVEKGLLGAGQFTDQHGELVEIPAGTTVPPQFIQAPPLAGIDGEINRAEFALEEASGMTSVLRGHNPTQARAAFQLEILREEAMTLFNDCAEKSEKSYCTQAKLALSLAQKRYEIGDVMSIVGRDRQGFALTWFDSCLAQDTRVKQGSMIPRNHALREAKLVELLQYGAFKDPVKGLDNTRLFWEMSELGTLNRSIDPEVRQRTRAREEAVRMLVRGEVVLPFEHEDHALHLEEHLSDLARPEWYGAPDARQAVMHAHIQAHRMLLTLEQAPEAMTDMDPVAGLVGGGNVPPQMQGAAGAAGGRPRVLPGMPPTAPARQAAAKAA